jgi:hypothetical protein
MERAMLGESLWTTTYGQERRNQSQYSLFSLGMFTYTYERQDIIQIALKILPGGERRKKKVCQIKKWIVEKKNGQTITQGMASTVPSGHKLQGLVL